MKMPQGGSHSRARVRMPHFATGPVFVASCSRVCMAALNAQSVQTRKNTIQNAGRWLHRKARTVLSERYFG